MTGTGARRPVAGFSLVEVLVALAIIAVGMLGIAKMHVLALESSSSAGARSVVAMEAAGMAASMHANRAYWAANAGTTQAYFSPGAAPVVSLGSGFECETQSCTAQEVAGYDLANFAAALSQVLPAGNTTINCQAAAPQAGGGLPLPPSCTLTVTWLEQTPGLFQGSQASAALGSNATVGVGSGAAPAAPSAKVLQQPQFTLYVVP